MSKDAVDLDAMLAAVEKRPDRCRVVMQLSEEHLAWVDAKVAAARSAGKVPPWTALCKVLTQLGYQGFYTNILYAHYVEHQG